ncbi:MAG: hypothetical protein NT126_02615 [Bacteroidetes bacterium]|nr:hypothetical protein [Bacteroidota bacterium]
MTNFIKRFSAGTIALLIGVSAFGQNCGQAIKDGGKLTLVIQSWTNPLLADAKFLKAKDDKKDEQIAAYNADVQSGKIAPASNYPMSFTFKKGNLNGWDEYILTTTIAGTDYSSYLFCNQDTLYQFRNLGVVRIGTAENPVGETVQGAQKLPTHMKVGDVLSPFQDFGFLYPQTMDNKVRITVSAGFKTYDKIGYGIFQDSKDNNKTKEGLYTTPTPYEIFKQVPVDVKEKISFSTHTINYVNAKVKAEEQVTISGVNYNAFIIESETWTNATMAVNYKSADKKFTTEQIIADIAGQDKKVEKKMERQALKIGYVNELGYNVTYKKEWFVPQIGIVKTVAFDTYGGISTIMTTTELQ